MGGCQSDFTAALGERKLTEKEKASYIISSFIPTSVHHVTQNKINLVYGRVSIAGNDPFCDPLDGVTCVYYHLRVDEEQIETFEYKDRDGFKRTAMRNVWVEILEHEQNCNFDIRDGNAKITVKAGLVRGDPPDRSTRMEIFRNNPPWGVAMLVDSVLPSHQWERKRHTTGQFRAFSTRIAVNDSASVLGVIDDAAMKELDEDAVKRYFRERPSPESQKDVLNYIAMSPCVVIAKNPKDPTPPLEELPKYMTETLDEATGDCNMYKGQTLKLYPKNESKDQRTWTDNHDGHVPEGIMVTKQ